MSQIFDNITVVDFSWGMAGSVATMVFSDFGANVIKVEPPEGDPFRSHPASLMWHRGKKSVILDLKTPAGQEQARDLALLADVVVVSFRPGTADRLGIGYEALAAQRPDIIYCSLTGFGTKGRYANFKGYEGMAAARSGRFMDFSGQSGREGPHYAAVQSANHTAAMAIVRGATAALYVRDKTGQGQKVETTLLQAISIYDFQDWVFWQMMLKDPERFPEDPWSNPQRISQPGYITARTKDGRWLQMANLIIRPFLASIEALGLEHIFENPRLKTAPMLTDEAKYELRELELQRINEKTLEEWMDLFVNHAPDVAAEPLMSTQEGMKHPQIVHNGHVQDVQDPHMGATKQLGVLALFRETPGTIKGPAPDPGQHTQEIINHTTNQTRPVTIYRNPQPLPKHPLEGITVIDQTTVLAGPLASTLLAEIGARVIRIETPQGDWMRENHHGVSTQRTMAGTEGMCINLKTQEGQELHHKLIAQADVLVHNMRPGTTERIGMGYEQAIKINPKLIYIYAAGYGSTGPYSHRPAMHPIPGAICGGAIAQAGRDTIPDSKTDINMDQIKELSRRLGRANGSNPDENTGMVIATAIAMGIYTREKTGKSQYIETTMLGANSYANADDFFWFDGRPPREIPDTNGYGLNALYRLYMAEQGWIFLACPLEKEWQSLCHAIKREDLLKDPRFITPETRSTNDDALAKELQSVFSKRSPKEWENILAPANVGCIQAEDRGSYHFFAEDSHIEDNELTTNIQTQRFGTLWRHSPLIKFSHTPGRTGSAPLKGEHTAAIMRELGYNENDINNFKARGIIDWENPYKLY
jgi:crotonobetainyl-CoA:carnitine CoA-transferase CaiB-like acyl-CoA transferase